MKLTRGSVDYCRRCFSFDPSLRHKRMYSSKQDSVVSGPQQSVPAPPTPPPPRVVLTGLQPTGALHVGNYFAAVRRCVQLQAAGDEVLVCIADLHALTGLSAGAGAGGATLHSRVLQLAALLLAAGLDPARALLWQQSAVPRHAELCWLLACLTSHARLAHLPQYRQRAQDARLEECSAGVLLYPVLQAADILLLGASHVPVGADQLQHVQLAALLARTARHRLGLQLTAPRALLPEDGSDRILSLRDPSKKMSKSEPDPKSRIMLDDEDDDIHRKIRKAVTDFTPQVTFAPESRPGVSNLVRLHCLCAGLTPEEAVLEAEHLTTAQYKAVVSAALVNELAPLRERARRLLASPAVLQDVLRTGAARARARADDTWARAAAAAGLKPPEGAGAAALRLHV